MMQLSAGELGFQQLPQGHPPWPCVPAPNPLPPTLCPPNPCQRGYTLLFVDPQAFKPLSGQLGFRQLPLGPTLLGHETPAPPPASTPSAAISGIAGMPAANTPPCRLVRFDRLATPRLNPPLGPGFKQPGLDPAGLSGQGLASNASAVARAAAGPQIHYSGVLVCGPKPLWLVASRGGFVAHPMDAREGAVDAFCGFDNVNCPQGFIAAGLTGNMRICTLPLQVRRVNSVSVPSYYTRVKLSAEHTLVAVAFLLHGCM